MACCSKSRNTKGYQVLGERQNTDSSSVSKRHQPCQERHAGPKVSRSVTEKITVVSSHFLLTEEMLRDAGSSSGPPRSPGGGHGNPLQSSCLENAMERGAWWLQSTGLQSRSRPRRLSMHTWYDGGLLTASFGTRKFLSLLTSLQVFVENQLMVSL